MLGLLHIIISVCCCVSNDVSLMGSLLGWKNTRILDVAACQYMRVQPCAMAVSYRTAQEGT